MSSDKANLALNFNKKNRLLVKLSLVAGSSN